MGGLPDRDPPRTETPSCTDLPGQGPPGTENPAPTPDRDSPGQRPPSVKHNYRHWWIQGAPPTKQYFLNFTGEIRRIILVVER